jgi:hypothetical protein
MIIKHAQHFLTPEGKVFFNNWVKELQAIAKKQIGFEHVWPMVSGEQQEEIHLFMIFADESAYQRWVSGDAHEGILNQLKPYQVKPWQAKTYIEA